MYSSTVNKWQLVNRVFTTNYDQMLSRMLSLISFFLSLLGTNSHVGLEKDAWFYAYLRQT